MKRIALAVAAVAAMFALLPAAALAATPPSVTTGGATNVTPTAATLSGTVNLNGATLSTTVGSPGACYFEYGTTTSYGSTASCTTAPSASGTSTVTANLSSLPAGTYDYQLVILTGGNSVMGVTLTGTTTTGGNESFSTPTTTTLPTAATAAASNVGGTSALMNGTVVPNNWGIQSCTFTYTPSGGSAQTTPCTSTPTSTGGSQSVSGVASSLAEGTAYSYSLSITYGSSSASQSVTSTSNGSFTTTAATIAGPANLTASTATLNGAVNPEGQSVTSCAFYYGTSTSSLTSVPCAQPASAISGTSPTTVTAAVSGLTAKTGYTQTVVLTTAEGNVVAPLSNFTTPAAAVLPTATAIGPTGLTSTTATLRANVNAGGEGVRGCEFAYSVNNLATAAGANQGVGVLCHATPSANGTQSVTVTLKGLAPGTKYYYQLLFDTYGGFVKSNIESFTTPRGSAGPTVAITKAVISATKRSAKFGFGRSGSTPVTKGYQCALATVTRNKVGKVRYASCRSPKSYGKLKAGKYEFLVRAGGTGGFGSPRTYKFTI